MTEDIYSIDFETYSAADIRNVGAYRYAADETTEILIMAIARNNEEPKVWDCVNDRSEALELLGEAIMRKAPIYAHNAQFEAAICKYLLQKTFGLRAPYLEQWRCTAAMARRAAIPSSLEAAGEFLGIKQEKDKAGAALIRKFSIPRRPTKKDTRTRILPQDAPEDFQRFCDYCVRDVEAEREIHHTLKAFELQGAVLDSFQFDLAMNDRGVPVNVNALTYVDTLIDEYSERLTEEFQGMTGFKPSQRALALEWLRNRGYPFDNLQAANVDQVLDNGPNGWEARYVEREREQAGFEWQQDNAVEIEEDVPDNDLAKWVKANSSKTPKKELPKIPSKFTTPKLQPVKMTWEGFKALEIRSKLSFAAVKKVPTMLAAACPDGMVRGSLLWSGAERTHRWAGRIIQPQNFRRPTFKGTEHAYKMLCEGADIDTIEMMFGPFLEVVASCIRHFIQWPKGDLLQADFSSVEARAAPWLCGGQRKLDMFERGEPIYETMASKIFGVPVEQVIEEHKNGDSSKRFIGKTVELGATYNMGWPKFRGTCESFGFSPTENMVEAYKPRFRKQLAKLRKLSEREEPWEEMEIKFPSCHWAQLRNKVEAKKFKGRSFTTWAYRKGGTRRAVKDPDNPTDEEWLDLCYDDLANRAVATWREDNPEIKDAWKALDIAAKDAIRNPGKIFKGTDKLSFGMTKKPGFPALVMRLPSGHTLVYPRAKLVWKGDEGQEVNWNDNYNTEIQFWGKVPMKSTWGWCKTYGGKLLENATQAICGDFMANSACIASKRGYDAFMLVHDELVGPKKSDEQTHEELCEILSETPHWAKGMPLAAEGATIPFYKK